VASRQGFEKKLTPHGETQVSSSVI